MAENININVTTPTVNTSTTTTNVEIASPQVSVSTDAPTTNVEIGVGVPSVETSIVETFVEIEIASPQVSVTTLNQAANGVQQIIAGVNTTVSPATGIGIVAVNALGSVSNVSVAAPLSTALVFNLPTNTPQLTIQNVSNPAQQFLRGDGTWAIPAGNSGVTSITAGVGLGAPATGNSITTSGTINLLAPTATVIGGVKAGTNTSIAIDGTISVLPPTATVIGGVKAGTNITIAVDGTISSSGGGGSAGTSWTAPSLIAVGDIVFASSPLSVIPGQTQAFNGTPGGGGVVWTSRVLPSSTTWVRAFFAFNLFIVVSTSGLLITSPDGVTWTQRTLPVAFQWIALAVSATTAVLFSSNSNTIALSSTDTITWTQRTVPALGTWSGVAFGNGIFVAVNSGNSCITSPDAVTWTQRVIQNIITFPGGIFFGNGTFFAFGAGGVCYASTDGITWANRPVGSGSYNFVGGVFANNTYVVLTTTGAFTSADGLTWTTRVLPGTGWTSLAFGNNTFLATTATGVVATSSDAITWALRSLPPSSIVGSVFAGFGAGAFVGVGNGPTAYRSPALNSLFTYPSSTTGLPLACSNGTYRLLGGNQNVTDGLWVRTA